MLTRKEDISAKTISVLIVDDSAYMRAFLSEVIRTDPSLQVIGTAGDPYEARQKIKELNPDVMTLDIEMPRMDGIAFLRNVMRLRPMPVVMVSSLTQKNAEIALTAIELGAVDYIGKLSSNAPRKVQLFAEDLQGKIKAAAIARLSSLQPERSRFRASQRLGQTTKKYAVIAVGASTGGTEAIRQLITGLGGDAPPMLIAQHIPGPFSEPFAARLSLATEMNVIHVNRREQLANGTIYVAPGDRHLVLCRTSSGVSCILDDRPPVNRHKPSVDVLFDSVSKIAGDRGIGILLTGMGSDGAEGLLRMHKAGATTIAQDEETSVVWGMPGEAVKRGAASHILPLHTISLELKSTYGISPTFGRVRTVP